MTAVFILAMGIGSSFGGRAIGGGVHPSPPPVFQKTIKGKGLRRCVAATV